MTDHSHRDLCSATSGILIAFHDKAKRTDSVDEETVERIARQFARQHDDLGAETPTPDFLED
jgi:hypothetical protein